MNKWKVNKRVRVLDNPYFPIEKHNVELPNGSIIDDFYVGKIKHGTLIIAVTNNKKIILVRQYKHGIGEITFELPGGEIDKDEEAINSAVRELREEVGIVYDPEKIEKLMLVSSLTTKMDFKAHIFLARDVEITEDQKLDENEEIEIHQFTKEEIIKMIEKESISASDSISGLLFAFQKYPELF